METAGRDYASRCKYFLLFMEKSRGTARDALKEALREIAKAELVSSEMQGGDVARLRIRSDAGEQTWYMAREKGRWVMAGGLCVKNGRGDWRSFEPSPHVFAPSLGRCSEHGTGSSLP